MLEGMAMKPEDLSDGDRVELARLIARTEAAKELIPTHPTLCATPPVSAEAVAQEISALRQALAVAICEGNAALIILQSMGVSPLVLEGALAESYDAMVAGPPAIPSDQTIIATCARSCRMRQS
jgi:hypothetical protein